MEKAMRSSLTLIAGLLAITGPASAEPGKKPEPANAAQAQPRPAPIVLASADAVRPAAPDSAQAAPSPEKRRVVPRVTSCRCGDPQAETEPQDQ
jgi:hypothetical protein